MLRYEVKLGKDNFKQRELVWREKYLSPDLSFISGVTDTSYHLEKFKALSSKNSIINSDSTLEVECYNVIRQGFVVAKQKKYEIHTGKTYDYSVNKEGDDITYNFVKINGKYFYEKDGKYYIDNLLNYEEGRTDDKGNLMEICEYIEVAPDGDYIKVDTVFWIEEGKVYIDGEEYIYDKDEGENGILKYGEDGISLDASAVTDCDSFEYHHYKSSNQYEEVTKFKLTKREEIQETFSRISFCNYHYYIKYKNHYCPIKRKINGDSYEFVCEIPKYIVNPTFTEVDGEIIYEQKEYDLEPIEHQVYYTINSGDGGIDEAFREAKDEGKTLDDAHYEEHGVKLLDELENVTSFVYIEKDDICVKVEHDIINANTGNEIAIYLNNIYSPLKVGEKVEFIDATTEKYKSLIYNANSYNGQDEKYVFLNGKKYLVQKNLCDKVIINDNEYDIDYINGKVADKDCIVIIGDERVPMKIDSTDGGDYANGEVKRYGWIISGDVKSVSKEVKYSIKPYDGILINGKKYIIYVESFGEGADAVELEYASLELPNKYTFSITEIIGNSMYVCKPFVNKTDFTEDFDRFISEQICKDVVDNQNAFELQVKNKVFGETEITEELAFRVSTTPVSNADFYNLFDDLKIYVDSGYIHIPLSLRMDVANNIQQEDIVGRDFFDAEKKKAINPIVDMEKDVYTPKFIYGYYEDNGDIHEYKRRDDKMYRGSKTIFKPIYKINVNFHFRTRDLTSWKVNDGYNQLRYSADTVNQSVDNWFITDFYPYRDILYNKLPVRRNSNENRMSHKEWEERVNILQETSDLMGLLYFTNDDIFYQRSKVAKSFARLSFYDSTDPQTQSLLATSCIFVDEHKLFKKFIDNSRKNLNEYGEFSEPQYRLQASTRFLEHNALDGNRKEDITRLHKINKVSVKTEFLGRKKDNIEEFSENGRNGCPYSIPSAHSYNTIIDEDHRVSSRLVVDNKHVTDTSSEGFYAYIFREYAEKLHPKPIYMKIEFNHAGIGKMIPFLIPMHWSGNTTDSGETGYNKMYPEHALKLSGDTVVNEITNLTDLDELKRGIPLSYVYAQTYIPLYAVYDFDRKEYGYVFDNRYVEQDENGVLNLNLFEMKVMNESDEKIEIDQTTGEPIDPEQRRKLNDIKHNLQERAIINVNQKQFNKNAFNIETE